MSEAQKTDNRRSRGAQTRKALMRAAERLMARSGPGSVTIRQIIAAAKQKNESALQYHFKSLQGLIEAIHEERSTLVRARRQHDLEKMLAMGKAPTLHALAALMVEPTFRLAEENLGFRRYIKAFSLTLALEEGSALSLVQRHGGGGEGGRELGNLLRAALPHLEEGRYRERMEMAVVFCAASMARHARQPQAFRGPAAEAFLTNLKDALAGLLAAP